MRRIDIHRLSHGDTLLLPTACLKRTGYDGFLERAFRRCKPVRFNCVWIDPFSEEASLILNLRKFSILKESSVVYSKDEKFSSPRLGFLKEPIERS